MITVYTIGTYVDYSVGNPPGYTKEYRVRVSGDFPGAYLNDPDPSAIVTLRGRSENGWSATAGSMYTIIGWGRTRDAAVADLIGKLLGGQ